MKHNRFLLSLSRAALLAVAAVGTLLGLSSTLSSCGGGGSSSLDSITFSEFSRGSKKIYLLGASAWMVMEGGGNAINNSNVVVQGYFYPSSGTPSRALCSCVMTPNQVPTDRNVPMTGQYTFDISTQSAPFSGANTFTSNFLGLAGITTCEVSTCKVTLNFDARTWEIAVTGSLTQAVGDGTEAGTLEEKTMPSGRFEVGR
ncbi:MAG: hypothetical protein ACI4O9_07870 [Akkermansia sp.]